MQAARGSGNECTGVNDGSKNSILTTYLADAWHWGAEMFCETEVRYIVEDKERGGYRVFYTSSKDKKSSARCADDEELSWVWAVSEI
jgi:hypothetical protein